MSSEQSEVSITTPTPQVEDDDVIYSHTSHWSDEKKAEYAQYLEQQKIDYEPTMKMGDHVIVEFGKRPMVISLRDRSEIRVRNYRVKTTPMVGEPTNSTFAVEDKVLRRRLEGKIDPDTLFEHILEQQVTNEIPLATNEHLTQANANQQLSFEEIEQMKTKGLSGAEIVKAVATSSKTFESKTHFSQLKWLKRKHEKYSTDVSVYAPTPFALVKTERLRDPEGILNMRNDTLAVILTMANIGADSRTFVVDGTCGLLTGAILQRQGGYGAVLNIHTTSKPMMQNMIDMNLSTQERSNLHSMPFDALASFTNRDVLLDMRQKAISEQQSKIDLEKKELAEATENPATAVAVTEATSPLDGSESAPSESLTTPPASSKGNNNNNNNNSKQQQNQKPQGKPRQAVITFPHPILTKYAHNILLHKGLQVVIASIYDPLSLLLPLLPHVLPSSPIVIYSQTLEPLTHALSYLVNHNLATNVRIFDHWYRELQVLPNRTHPLMSMDATGGYILHAYTLEYNLPLNESVLFPAFKETNNAVLLHDVSFKTDGESTDPSPAPGDSSEGGDTMTD